MKCVSLVLIVLITLKYKTNAGTIRQKINKFEGHNDARMHPEFRSVPQLKLNRPDELNTNFWLNNAKAFVTKQLARSPSTKPAKNIILFIGDGMSLTTQSAARMYMGGEEKSLFFEEFPYVATAKTYCLDYQVADS